MSNLKLTANGNPTKINPKQNALTNKVTNGFNVFTIEPSGNYSAEVRMEYGSDLKTIKPGAGAKVPYPFSVYSDDANVRVTNISSDENQSIKAGWFTLSSDPTSKLTDKTTPVNQYNSIGGQAKSSPQTLSIKSRSSSAILALVFIGSDSPIPVFLNSAEGNIPKSWENLENAKFRGNTYTLTKNFFGQTIFIANVGLNADDVITASLL